MAPAEQYGYAVARLRAMSGRLIEESLLQRILDSEDLDGALKILGETAYAPWLLELKRSGDFDAAIEAELLHVYNEVQKFIPDPALVSICRMPYDFHNVKVLIKSNLLVREGGERRFDLLTSLGNIPVDDLIMAMEGEDYRLLPFGLHLLIPHAFSVWEQTKDVLEIEKILDSGLFSAMSKSAAETGIEAVVKWVRGRIDAENVRSLVRMKRMDMETGACVAFLHEGGLISREKLISLLSEPVESWGKLLSFADTAAIFNRAQDSTDLNNLVVEMGKVVDEFVASLVEESKYDAFAPEYVLSFLWKKEMEAKNIRIALVSVSNNTDKTLTRGLFRHVS